MKELIKDLNKRELKELIKLATEKLNASFGIGDTIIFTINYMIGDANGNTSKSTRIKIKSQDHLDAITVLEDIMTHHFNPNPGTWGFMLDEENLIKKPKAIYNILCNQNEAPEKYIDDWGNLPDIHLNPNILTIINQVVDKCFRSDTSYSFLVYENYTITQ